jgi:hypothetical protein
MFSSYFICVQKLPSRSVPLEQSEARGKKCDTNLRKEFALVALFCSALALSRLLLPR